MESSRVIFFTTALNILRTAAEISDTELYKTAHALSPQIDKYLVPQPQTKSFASDMLDHHSMEFIPSDAPIGFVPLRTTPNGNCFYNAMSLSIVGDETMSTELRVRTALALLQLKETLLQPNNSMVSDLISEQIVLYAPFAQNQYDISPKPTQEQLMVVFRDEIISSLQNYSWAGMWQLQALCTALNIAIFSVYPEFNQRIRPHFNRIVTPVLPYDERIDLIPILWTGYKNSNGTFQPNHFVPLVDSCRLHVPMDISESDSKNVKTCLADLNNTHQNNTESIASKTTPLEANSARNHTNSTKVASSFPENTQESNTAFQCYPHLPKHYCCSCRQLILSQKPSQCSTHEKNHYLCSVCNGYQKKKKHSPICTQNLDPGIIPSVLKCLTNTEVHMVSLVHPYMNLLKLPAGGQYGQKGQSINIPVPVADICSQLPISPNNLVVLVKSHKENSISHLVNMNKIFCALHWLKQHNTLYATVTLEANIPNNEVVERKTEEDHNYQDLSLIPNDYIVPCKADKESTKKNVKMPPSFQLPFINAQPINTFEHPNVEELAFPHLYPYGCKGYTSLEKAVTYKQYFTCRMLNADKRWSSCIPYLFWALNIYEQNLLQSCISIAVRMNPSSSEQLKAKHILSNQFSQYVSEDFRFMKTMKGTAAYWREELYNLLAKMSILGPPTFFMSLSSNDANWLELYKFMDPSLSTEDLTNLDATTKAKMVRENPVKSAIYFSKRWETFLKMHILGDSEPIGKVMDYYARIEFQNRGSPHIHAFFWIKGAPDMETTEGRKAGVVFIDKYISAQLPEETDSMYNLVRRLQTHSHTHTCYKSKSRHQCRFDFPRQPSECTEIQLSNISLTTGRFYKLARSNNSLWINPYNPTILKLWNANMDIQVVGCKNAAAAYVCTYVCKNEPNNLKAALASTIKSIPSDASVRKRLSRVGNILLTHRLISSQEASYRLLHIPMVYSSRETVFISSSTPDKRYKILKPKESLKKLPKDSSDIFAQSIHDIYSRRPNTTEFNCMCLAFFATNFVLLKSTEKISAQSKLRRFKLTGSPEQYIRDKKQQSCFRSHIPKISKDKEGYFHAVLCLFLPWRKHEDIITPYQSYSDAYIHKHLMMEKKSIENFKFSEKIEAAVQHIRALQQEEQDDIHCPVTPAFMAEHLNSDVADSEYLSSIFTIKDYTDAEESTAQKHASYTDEDFRALSEYNMTDQEYSARIDACTTEQLDVLHIVDERLRKQKNNSSSYLHLFITGGAGCGKSFLLQLLREHILRKNTCCLPNVLVAAPTGVAAFNIKAWTLHRLLNLDVQHKNQAIYTPLSAKQLSKMRRIFKQVEVLIIDEISMVSANTLLHIHKRLTEIKDTANTPEAVFGNIHIITFGDLYQLRPVYGGAVFSDHSDMALLHLWKDLFWCVELTINVRQNKDPQYAQLLNKVRDGTHTAEDIDILMTCKIDTSQQLYNFQHIYPTRKQCQEHNEKKLSEASSHNLTIHRIHALDDPNTDVPDDDTFCGGLNKTISACVGAKVMLLRNINTTSGLVNGAQGKIINFHWHNGKAQEYNGQQPMSIEVLFDDPTVGSMFKESEHKPIMIKPITISYYNSQRVAVSRTQFPLAVSYAVTVHKVQGLTLQEAAVDIGQQVFTAGMAYVALSRVSTMKGLKILNISPDKIYASKSVQTEMDRLRSIRVLPKTH